MPLSGVGLLLKSMGLNPEEILPMVDSLKVQLPGYLNGLAHKVQAIETRLASIEEKQDRILNILDPEKYRALERIGAPNGNEQLTSAVTAGNAS